MGGTSSPRRQCSRSRNQPSTASPASSRSSRRPTPSRAALQGRLRGPLPSLVNGMSVCPSTTNTEGRITTSSMPALMRPRGARAARHVWVLPAAGKPQLPNTSRLCTLKTGARGPQDCLQRWGSAPPLSPSPSSSSCPTPPRPHVTLTHGLSHFPEATENVTQVQTGERSPSLPSWLPHSRGRQTLIGHLLYGRHRPQGLGHKRERQKALVSQSCYSASARKTMSSINKKRRHSILDGDKSTENTGVVCVCVCVCRGGRVYV